MSDGDGRVAAVVVTHVGASRRLARCLDALDGAGGLARVVVVDNSDDGEPIATAHTVLRTANRGFGAAANVGLAALADDRPWAAALLNDDVVVSPGWLDPLVAELAADDTVGAVQPMLVLVDATPPTVNSLGVAVDRYGAGADVGLGTAVADVDPRPRDVTAVTGGAVLFRQDFLDDVLAAPSPPSAGAGPFDERYFLYYEDVDLARRGTERGWRYRCAPESVVTHAMGASTGALGDERRRLQERNRLWCTARHGDAGDLARAISLSLRRLRHPPRRTHLRALLGGLAGLPRRRWERRTVRRSDAPQRRAPGASPEATA